MLSIKRGPEMSGVLLSACAELLELSPVRLNVAFSKEGVWKCSPQHLQVALS